MEEIEKIAHIINTTNELKEKMSDDWGAFSAYFKIRRNLGLKVILHWCLSYSHEYKTQKELFTSRLWRNAIKEFKYQKIAFEKIGCVPKIYDVRPIKLTDTLCYNWWEEKYSPVNGWFPGIWMEHIYGIKLDLLYPHGIRKEYGEIRDMIINWMKRKFRKEVGLNLIDLHQENIIVKTSKDEKIIKDIKVIDFSPTFIREIKIKSK